MELKRNQDIEIPADLLENIEAFPLYRDITHCGETFQASSFDIYADCPRCGKRIKVRSFGGSTEIEDIFDAVFEWMSQPGAEPLVRLRQQILLQDRD